MSFIIWFSSISISRSITYYLLSISVKFVVTFIHFLTVWNDLFCSFVYCLSALLQCSMREELYLIYILSYPECPAQALTQSWHLLSVFWVNEWVMKRIMQLMAMWDTYCLDPYLTGLTYKLIRTKHSQTLKIKFII